MARSLRQIFQTVQAEQAVLQSLGDEEGAGLEEGAAVHYRQTYSGELRHVDELVIGVGDRAQFSLDAPDYPLTDLYHWLVGVLNTAGGGLNMHELRGRLTITATFTATDEDAGEDW